MASFIHSISAHVSLKTDTQEVATHSPKCYSVCRGERYTDACGSSQDVSRSSSCPVRVSGPARSAALQLCISTQLRGETLPPPVLKGPADNKRERRPQPDAVRDNPAQKKKKLINITFTCKNSLVSMHYFYFSLRLLYKLLCVMSDALTTQNTELFSPCYLFPC